ncbi:MAG: hypothetical protein M2R45_05075 [Verrucomicrobia subdivision 3 bacterium]|nr:hypothetical protein [Limisphaerales bacterium]MCS1417152.1 hypothetical protein [Limisphaerales bacterium]
MIRLHPNYLIIKMSSGEQFPCPAEIITVKIIGEAVSWMSEEVVKNIAMAVLHFFREEQGRDVVSVAEFSEVLEDVLQSFGYSVGDAVPPKRKRLVWSTDINELIQESEGELELAMYQRLRSEMKRLLKSTPDELRFSGLRGCVKRVIHAQRWSRRCQTLSDQIVAFMRECLDAHAASNCSLVVKG